MKLVLCAGTRRVEGFTHHDVQGDQDILCDLFDIENHVKPGTCSEIHFTHALEHFPTKKIPHVLALVRSLLEPGGKLYIEVPNFRWHSDLVRDGRDRDAVYYAFGGQEDEYDFHKTAFTPYILREDLDNAGFIDVEINDSSSIECWCKTPRL